MWGSGHDLIWISYLSYFLCCHPTPQTASKIYHFYSSPSPSPPSISFLFSANQWQWPIHLPFFFILQMILQLCHIPYPMTPRAICRHLLNVSESCDLTLGVRVILWCKGRLLPGVYVCYLTLGTAAHPWDWLTSLCWEFKAGKVDGPVNSKVPTTSHLWTAQQSSCNRLRTCERPRSANLNTVTQNHCGWPAFLPSCLPSFLPFFHLHPTFLM